MREDKKESEGGSKQWGKQTYYGVASISRLLKIIDFFCTNVCFASKHWL